LSAIELHDDITVHHVGRSTTTTSYPHLHPRPPITTHPSHRIPPFNPQCAISETAIEPYLQKRTLFISEIKTVKPDLPDDQQNDCLLDDMTLQMLVHNTLQPKRSLLTFRLPWRAGKTDYLKGWGCCSPLPPSEMRSAAHLLTSPPSKIPFRQASCAFPCGAQSQPPSAA
jgi:hypothetical protein